MLPALAAPFGKLQDLCPCGLIRNPSQTGSYHPQWWAKSRGKARPSPVLAQKGYSSLCSSLQIPFQSSGCAPGTGISQEGESPTIIPMLCPYPNPNGSNFWIFITIISQTRSQIPLEAFPPACFPKIPGIIAFSKDIFPLNALFLTQETAIIPRRAKTADTF